MGLNDSYGNVKIQILLTEPLSTISKVYYLILREQKHRQIGQITEVIVEPTALYVNNPNSKGHQGY